MIATVDMRWPIVLPARIPVSHHYPLLAALSKIVPEVHSGSRVGVHPIHGSYLDRGILELGPSSAVVVRASSDLIPSLLPLSGTKLDIAGCPVRVGVPRLIVLRPAERLRSDLVTIKGYMEIPDFEPAVRRQLDTLQVRDSVRITVGRRRIRRIRDQTIVGFGLQVSELTESESIRIQEYGVGGRRHFGCGLFQPEHAGGNP